MGLRGMNVPAPQLNGAACVIHVLPLRHGDIRQAAGRRAVAALFVTPTGRTAQVPTDALAHLYDFTPTEAQIFELICQGLKQEEISSELGIARSTVKTHLLRVFKKTGCDRQVDLVKLAGRLSAPVS